MQLELITTDDGSHSIFLPEINENYHSTHGALTEAIHIYLHLGLDKVREHKKQINILEVGLGTGLNAWLTLLNVRDGEHINYTALEAYPVERTLLDQLNYASNMDHPKAKESFDALHNAPWNETVELSPAFALTKLETTLQTAHLTQDYYDVVYFDAFGPEAQPEMWTYDVFQQVVDAMAAGGVMTTYCAKGQVRRDWKTAGLTMERAAGPINGKREVLRGIKS